MNIIKYTLLAFLLTINSYLAYSQQPSVNSKTERISLEQGFSNDLVFSIFQDSKGFIWFGTMFGLVKYDGVNYKTYRFDPLDTNSLSNDDIISIFEDRDGMMWFGTFNGGVNRYDRVTNSFTRFVNKPEDENSVGSNTVWNICQDKDGVIWLATQGGGLNKFENGKFYSYKKDTLNVSGSISGNFIRSVHADRSGNIWAGTFGSGVNKFDKKNNTFTNYRNDPDNIQSISDNFVTAIFESSKGDLWFGTGGGGINKFGASEGRFTRYRTDFGPGSNFVNSISEDAGGGLLLGTQDGLIKFNETAGKFEKMEINRSDSLRKDIVIDFIKDRTGVIWLSSYNDGLFKISFPNEKFKSSLVGKNVKCILEDRTGKLWAGTHGNGLMISEDNGKSFISLQIKANPGTNTAGINKINSLAEDKDGFIWTGTENGLMKVDSKGNVIKKFFNDGNNENSVLSNNILKLLFDSRGTLWIGTDRGLDKFDPVSESFIHYQNVRSDPESLSENTILSLYEDKYGELWIGTFAGLNRLDRAAGKFKHYIKDPGDPKTISNNYVFSFNEDKNNNFWIGTGGGLNIFDRDAGTFFHFTEKEGLPNGVIAGIESDDDGYLWISTYKGISRLSVKERVFRNFDSQDGLLSNMFNTGSYYKNSKGEIFFGNLNGVNYFFPADVRENNFNAPVILTTLTRYEDKKKIESDISSVSNLDLSYKDNFIRLGFTSVDYANPLKNNFAYKLEGFEKDWNYSGNSREAVYTNLDPGNYVFKVKGTNSDGLWNESTASVNIFISPPFWKTWWFYGLVLLMITGAVIFIQNYRIRRKLKYVMELEKIKERERELMREQASRDYHDELGHKLTRISLYSRRINKKLRPTANGLTEDLNSIVETSNSLQSGAKDLIWAMNPDEDSLYDFTVRLRDFGNELFENTGINFTSEGIKNEFRDIRLSMNCKRHLIYIFKEGMNNILKYSRCSNVDLCFRIYGNDLEIILKDDGRGFDQENCPKGYGLKNIYSRAKQIDVNVNIYSDENSGTEIKLSAHLANLILN